MLPSVNRDVAKTSTQNASGANRVITPRVDGAESGRRLLPGGRASRRTRGMNDANDVGAVDQERSEDNEDGSGIPTISRKPPGDADTVSTSPDPYNSTQPNDSYRHFPPSLTVKVVLDHSHNRTIYETFNNSGQHATMHGSSAAQITYFAERDVHSAYFYCPITSVLLPCVGSPNNNDEMNERRTANDRRRPSPRST